MRAAETRVERPVGEMNPEASKVESPRVNRTAIRRSMAVRRLVETGRNPRIIAVRAAIKRAAMQALPPARQSTTLRRPRARRAPRPALPPPNATRRKLPEPKALLPALPPRIEMLQKPPAHKALPRVLRPQTAISRKSPAPRVLLPARPLPIAINRNSRALKAQPSGLRPQIATNRRFLAPPALRPALPRCAVHTTTRTCITSSGTARIPAFGRLAE